MTSTFRPDWNRPNRRALSETWPSMQQELLRCSQQELAGQRLLRRCRGLPCPPKKKPSSCIVGHAVLDSSMSADRGLCRTLRRIGINNSRGKTVGKRERGEAIKVSSRSISTHGLSTSTSGAKDSASALMVR